MNTIKKDMRGEEVRGYAVQYPASARGADIGINDVVTRVTSQAKACPNQKFALVGYSQGGMVVSSAAPKIPTDLRQKVVAIALYGAGTGIGTADIKQKMIANCAPGDMCGKPTGVIGHFTYGSTGTAWHARVSKYIISGFHGQLLSYKLETSPT
jgi:cutinase